MLRTALLGVLVIAASPACAQDIVGLEDCGQARSLDKKAGCLQANVEFLHRLIKKNDAAAQAALRDQAARLGTANARLDDLRAEFRRLQAAVDQLERKIPKQ